MSLDSDNPADSNYIDEPADEAEFSKPFDAKQSEFKQIKSTSESNADLKARQSNSIQEFNPKTRLSSSQSRATRLSSALSIEILPDEEIDRPLKATSTELSHKLEDDTNSDRLTVLEAQNGQPGGQELQLPSIQSHHNHRNYHRHHHSNATETILNHDSSGHQKTSSGTKSSELSQAQQQPSNLAIENRLDPLGASLELNSSNNNQISNAQLILQMFLYSSSFLLLIILGISIYNCFQSRGQRSRFKSCGRFYKNRKRRESRNEPQASLTNFIGKIPLLYNRRKRDSTEENGDQPAVELDPLRVTRSDDLNLNGKLHSLGRNVVKSSLVVALKSATKPKITLAGEKMRKFIDDEAQELRFEAENFGAAARTYEGDDFRKNPNKILAFFLFLASQLTQSLTREQTSSCQDPEVGNDNPVPCTSGLTYAKRLDTIEECDKDEQVTSLPLDIAEETGNEAPSKMLTLAPNQISLAARRVSPMSPVLMVNQQQADLYSSLSACSLFSTSSSIENSNLPNQICSCLQNTAAEMTSVCPVATETNSTTLVDRTKLAADFQLASSFQPVRSKSQGNSPCNYITVNSTDPNETNLTCRQIGDCYPIARACCSASPTALSQTQAKFVDQCAGARLQYACHQQTQLPAFTQLPNIHPDPTKSPCHLMQLSSQSNGQAQFNRSDQHQQQPNYLRRNYENYYDDEQTDCLTASLAGIELGFGPTRQPNDYQNHHLRHASLGHQFATRYTQNKLSLNCLHNHHQQQQPQQQYNNQQTIAAQIASANSQTQFQKVLACSTCASCSGSQCNFQQLSRLPAAPTSIIVQQASLASRSASPSPQPCATSVLRDSKPPACESPKRLCRNMHEPSNPIQVNNLDLSVAPTTNAKWSSDLLDAPHELELIPANLRGSQHGPPRRTSIAGDRISSRLAQSGLLGSSSGLTHNHFLHRASIASSDGSQWLHTNCGQQLARSLTDQAEPAQLSMGSDQVMRPMHAHFNYHQLQCQQQGGYFSANCEALDNEYPHCEPHMASDAYLHCGASRPSECSSMASSLHDPTSCYYSYRSGAMTMQSAGKSTYSSSGGSSSGIGISGSACTNVPSSASYQTPVTSYVPDSSWHFQNQAFQKSQQQSTGQQHQELQYFCTLQHRHNHVSPSYGAVQAGASMVYPSLPFASWAAQPISCDSRRQIFLQGASGPEQVCCPSRKFSLPTQLESQAAERYSKSGGNQQPSELLFKPNRLNCGNQQANQVGSARNQQQPTCPDPIAAVNYVKDSSSLSKVAQKQQENSESRRSSQTITRQSSFWLDDSNSLKSISSLTNVAANGQVDQLLCQQNQLPHDNDDTGTTAPATMMRPSQSHLISNESSIDSIKRRPSIELSQVASANGVSGENLEVEKEAEAEANNQEKDSIQSTESDDAAVNGGLTLGSSQDDFLKPSGSRERRNRWRSRERKMSSSANGLSLERRGGSERGGSSRPSKARRLKNRLSSSSTNSSTNSSPSPDFGRPSERILGLAPKSGSISKRHFFCRFRSRQQASKGVVPLTSASCDSEPSTSFQRSDSRTTPEPKPCTTSAAIQGDKVPNRNESKESSPSKPEDSVQGETKITHEASGEAMVPDPARIIPDLNSCRDLWKLRATLHDNSCAGDDWANYHQRLNRRYDSGYKSIEDQMTCSLEASLGLPTSPLASSRQNSNESAVSSVPEMKSEVLHQIDATSRPPSGCSGLMNPEVALREASSKEEIACLSREMSKSPVDLTERSDNNAAE